jgi:hypothetical protein
MGGVALFRLDLLILRGRSALGPLGASEEPAGNEWRQAMNADEALQHLAHIRLDSLTMQYLGQNLAACAGCHRLPDEVAQLADFARDGRKPRERRSMKRAARYGSEPTSKWRWVVLRVSVSETVCTNGLPTSSHGAARCHGEHNGVLSSSKREL